MPQDTNFILVLQSYMATQIFFLIVHHIVLHFMELHCYWPFTSTGLILLRVISAPFSINVGLCACIHPHVRYLSRPWNVQFGSYKIPRLRSRLFWVRKMPLNLNQFSSRPIWHAREKKSLHIESYTSGRFQASFLSSMLVFYGGGNALHGEEYQVIHYLQFELVQPRDRFTTSLRIWSKINLAWNCLRWGIKGIRDIHTWKYVYNCLCVCVRKVSPKTQFSLLDRIRTWRAWAWYKVHLKVFLHPCTPDIVHIFCAPLQGLIFKIFFLGKNFQTV